jgi:hypothetical protein
MLLKGGFIMSKAKKSWREKLEEDKGFPKVFKVDGKMRKRWGGGTCVIPSPLEVDELMRRVRKGKVTTIDQMRSTLAARHGATFSGLNSVTPPRAFPSILRIFRGIWWRSYRSGL